MKIVHLRGFVLRVLGSNHYRILPLHSQIPREEQRLVFEPVPDGVIKVCLCVFNMWFNITVKYAAPSLTCSIVFAGYSINKYCRDQHYNQRRGLRHWLLQVCSMLIKKSCTSALHNVSQRPSDLLEHVLFLKVLFIIIIIYCDSDSTDKRWSYLLRITTWPTTPPFGHPKPTWSSERAELAASDRASASTCAAKHALRSTRAFI